MNFYIECYKNAARIDVWRIAIVGLEVIGSTLVHRPLALFTVRDSHRTRRLPAIGQQYLGEESRSSLTLHCPNVAPNRTTLPNPSLHPVLPDEAVSRDNACEQAVWHC